MVLLIYTRSTSHNFGYASFLALRAMRKSERHAPRDKLTFKSGLRVGFRVRISSQDLESGSRVRISSQDFESDFESGFRARILSQDLETGLGYTFPGQCIPKFGRSIPFHFRFNGLILYSYITRRFSLKCYTTI